MVANVEKQLEEAKELVGTDMVMYFNIQPESFLLMPSSSLFYTMWKCDTFLISILKFGPHQFLN